MAKKKKDDIEFIPSKYQKQIFEYLQHNNGNMVIEAAAGSGKTSTLVQAIKLIPSDKKILFCAFNKDIVKELKKKVGDIDNVDIRTVHSLGYLMIQRNIHDKKLIINENKYRAYILNNIKSYSSIDLWSLNKTDYMKYIDNICRLSDFCRYNLVDTIKGALVLVERHDIELIADEIDVVLKIMEWGKLNLDELDYTDMVWIPNVLYLKPVGLQYDFIMGDEAQDFSVAQRELLLKCKKMGTRYIFCGDKNQCIYSFASASPDTFDKLKSLPNTTTLPLSISYRCAKNIVKFAQNLVPSIEPNDSPRIGEIEFNSSLADIKDGDMVLCRNNAPLMKAYNEFIRMGKKCKIRGKDIGMNLIRVVESTHQEFLNSDLLNDGVFARLYDNLFTERNKIIKKTCLDKASVMNMSIIENKLDVIRALEVLSENINHKDELIEKIKNMFSDKKTDGISLSTIHKAKGLEAKNVYIACRSLMPSRSATQDWEVEQEKNLMYVAYTRAKDKLSFIDEKEFSDIKNTQDKLENIEKQISNLFNKNLSCKPMTREDAKIAAMKMQKISPRKIGASTNLENKEKKNTNNLTIITPRKLTKLKRN